MSRSVKVRVYRYVGSYGDGLQFIKVRSFYDPLQQYSRVYGSWKLLGVWSLPLEMLKQLRDIEHGDEKVGWEAEYYE